MSNTTNTETKTLAEQEAELIAQREAQENEILDKMFQETADYINLDDSKNVTADEVRDEYDKAYHHLSVSSICLGPNVDVTAENKDNLDQEIIEEMIVYMKNHIGPQEYVVRGALLECNKGSHQRRMHLSSLRNIMHTIAHGNEYWKSIPFSPYSTSRFDEIMCANDNGAEGRFHDETIKSDADTPNFLKKQEGYKPLTRTVNIPFFGICDDFKSIDTDLKITMSYKKRQKIVEDPNAQYGYSWDPKYQHGVIRGDKCIPQIIGKWQNVKDDLIIGSSYRPMNYEGSKANDLNDESNSPVLTNSSFLVCACGGIIRIVRSGQADGKKAGQFYGIDGIKKD